MGRFVYKQDTRPPGTKEALLLCLAFIFSFLFFPSESAAQSLIYFGDTFNETLSDPGTVKGPMISLTRAGTGG